MNAGHVVCLSSCGSAIQEARDMPGLIAGLVRRWSTERGDVLALLCRGMRLPTGGFTPPSPSLAMRLVTALDRALVASGQA